MQLDIYGGFYKSQSLPVSAQQLINAFVQVQETTGGLSQATINPMPGLTQRATTGAFTSDINRGVWEMDGVPYFVNGTDLVSLDSSHTLSTLSSAVTGTGELSLSDNGYQLFILIPGGSGFTWNATTSTFAQITDADFTANGAPQYVCFIDGYSVCTTSTKKFIISALNDSMSWNALDFGSAETDPDAVVAPWVLNNRLYIFGTETIQPYRNTGNVDFPFETVIGGTLNKGLFAPRSLVNGSDHMYWVGGGRDESASIWRSSGNSPEPISTIAIDKTLQRVDDPSSIVSWSYSKDGAIFIGFRLPDTTLVYDETNNLWHERQSRYTSGTGVEYKVGWRCSSLCAAYNNVYVGDSLDGRIGTIENESFSEYTDDNIIRTIVTQPFIDQMDSFFLPTLELTMESGVGNATSTDPKIRLSISRDGGRSFSPERSRGIGPVGDFGRRAIWNRNGKFSQSAVFKWEWSEPATYQVIRADAKIKKGLPRYSM
jgi:hypothetical protein